ncbi:MAG: hypothetical protein H0T89_16895 [Deltaproteobacteria bacterium]|nr:hypothetical protein [Deltaproteobacteria bacterium]MDQ3297024.1 major royal jelly family protein [Myxococcota bacterium]
MKHLALLLVACGGVACGGGRPAPAPDPVPQGVVVETTRELAVGPGNIAMTVARGVRTAPPTDASRMILSLHQFYEPQHPVVEVHGTTMTPFPDPATYAASGAPPLNSVLGIRADERGVIWMLDNAMRGGKLRQLVGWNADANKLEAAIDLTAVTPDNAFLNDLAVDRTHGAIYIADPAGGKNAALIVVDLATGGARRVLEGHASVIPNERDLVIDGTPVEIKQPDGTLFRPHVGINPIALDARDEWLYFGPMHGDKLHRIRTADLRDPTVMLAARVEAYADRPITDGISIDSAGNIYLGDLANNAIGVIGSDRRYRELARGPELSWVDAFSFGPDGNYHVVANQLHRSAFLHAGVDATQPPFRILRFKPLAPGRVGR